MFDTTEYGLFAIDPDVVSARKERREAHAKADAARYHLQETRRDARSAERQGRRDERVQRHQARVAQDRSLEGSWDEKLATDLKDAGFSDDELAEAGIDALPTLDLGDTEITAGYGAVCDVPFGGSGGDDDSFGALDTFGLFDKIRARMKANKIDKVAIKIQKEYTNGKEEASRDKAQKLARIVEKEKELDPTYTPTDAVQWCLDFAAGTSDSPLTSSSTDDGGSDDYLPGSGAGIARRDYALPDYRAAYTVPAGLPPAAAFQTAYRTPPVVVQRTVVERVPARRPHPFAHPHGGHAPHPRPHVRPASSRLNASPSHVQSMKGLGE